MIGARKVKRYHRTLGGLDLDAVLDMLPVGACWYFQMENYAEAGDLRRVVKNRERHGPLERRFTTNVFLAVGGNLDTPHYVLRVEKTYERATLQRRK